jgi:hypothetical protein
MFLIRFVFYFVLSFAILCIPTGDNLHLFDRLYSLVTPYAEKAVKTTKQKLTTTKKYSKKLYSNSDPNQTDTVQTKSSAVKKKIVKRDEPAEDTYTEEEERRLQKILNQNE